ncbi:MAG: 2-hydroxyacid dehydrogenase [Cyanobacteria bacterium J06606_4]
MKVACFSTKPYDQTSLIKTNQSFDHELTFFEARLTPDTAELARGYPAICAFINDDLGEETLRKLAAGGTTVIALRSAGFNHVNLERAKALGMGVVRVPAYSPYAVAEHAVGLILMLNRKLYRAYNRVREDNFSLNGLLGFDLHGKTVGIVGTGKIGLCFASIMHGFGCRLLAYDVQKNDECLAIGVRYLPLEDLLAQANIISLHCPLLPATHHLINAKTLSLMQPGTMLINTSRGGLIDTPAIVEAIKSGQIGYFGADVYEEEANLFFEDLSDTVIQDDTFQRLQSFPNVVITAHQSFFTQEALTNIAETTLANISQLESGQPCENQVS